MDALTAAMHDDSSAAVSAVPSGHLPRALFGVLAGVIFCGVDWGTQYVGDLLLNRVVQDAVATLIMLYAIALIAAIPLGIMLATRWMRGALAGRVSITTPAVSRLLWTQAGLSGLAFLYALRGLFSSDYYEMRSSLYALIMLVPLAAAMLASRYVLMTGRRVGKDLARVAFVVAPLTVAWFNPVQGLLFAALSLWGLFSLRGVQPAPAGVEGPPVPAAAEEAAFAAQAVSR